MTDPLLLLVRALATHAVRYVLIGVSGANLYAPSGGAVFVTEDHDLFLPPDANNLVRAWQACQSSGLELWSGAEPLERPRNEWLARRVVEHRALTRGTGTGDLQVDLTLVMAAYDFETVWHDRRQFVIDDVEIAGTRSTGCSKRRSNGLPLSVRRFCVRRVEAMRPVAMHRIVGPRTDSAA